MGSSPGQHERSGPRAGSDVDATHDARDDPEPGLGGWIHRGIPLAAGVLALIGFVLLSQSVRLS